MSGELVATIVMRPASGRSLDDAPALSAETLPDFAPDPAAVAQVRAALEAAGFTVGPLVGIAMSIAGPSPAFEAYFGIGVETAAAGGWSAGGARELPVPPDLAPHVHAVSFESPAEAVT